MKLREYLNESTYNKITYLDASLSTGTKNAPVIIQASKSGDQVFIVGIYEKFGSLADAQDTLAELAKTTKPDAVYVSVANFGVALRSLKSQFQVEGISVPILNAEYQINKETAAKNYEDMKTEKKIVLKSKKPNNIETKAACYMAYSILMSLAK